MSALISVVTISFNQRGYLEKCVRSVIDQKQNFVEYIVVDPGSTDGSREFLQQNSANIDHLILEPDDGPADGLNKGFGCATGRYGYFLNSDDFLLPGALERLRRLWLCDDETDVLLCRSYLVDECERPLRELVPTTVDRRSLAYGSATIVQHGMSFKMDMFRRIGGFNPKNRSNWDYELLCDLLLQGAQTRLAPERLGVFRLHAQGLTGGREGDVHVRRYQADRDRVFEHLIGRAPNRLDRWRIATGRLPRFIRNPGLISLRLRDALLPGLLQSRYSRDMMLSRDSSSAVNIDRE